MLMKTKIFWIFVLIVAWTFYSQPAMALAQDSNDSLKLICFPNQRDCKFIPKNKPLFKADNLQPGQTVHSYLTVVNQTDNDCYLRANFSDNAETTPDDSAVFLADMIKIYVDDSQQALIQEELSSLFKLRWVKMGQVAAKSELKLHWMALLNKLQMDNSYQGSQTGFDLKVNVVCLTQDEAEVFREGQVLGATTENNWQELLLDMIEDIRASNIDWRLVASMIRILLYWGVGVNFIVL